MHGGHSRMPRRWLSAAPTFALTCRIMGLGVFWGVVRVEVVGSWVLGVFGV